MVLFLQASVILSEKWEGCPQGPLGPQYPGVQLPWLLLSHLHTVSLISPSLCGVEGRGPKPYTRIWLLTRAGSTGSSPFSTGPCPQNHPPPPPAASPTLHLAAFPPPRSYDNPTSSAGERVCCSDGVGVGVGGCAIIFHKAQDCSLLSL